MPQVPQTHIVDSENYKHLEAIHFKLTFDKEYRKEFHTFLAELEKNDTQIPKTYDELETAYRTFSDRYAKTHH